MKKNQIIYIIYTNEKKGGKKKFENLIPIILVGYNNDIRDISVIAINIESEQKPSIVLIPEEMFHLSDNIDRDKLIFITEDIESFFSKLSDELDKVL